MLAYSSIRQVSAKSAGTFQTVKWEDISLIQVGRLPWPALNQPWIGQNPP